jgi:hypothetical protein
LHCRPPVREITPAGPLEEEQPRYLTLAPLRSLVCTVADKSGL